MTKIPEEKIQTVAQAISFLKLSLEGITPEELQQIASDMEFQANRYDSAAAFNRNYSPEKSEYNKEAATSMKLLADLVESFHKCEKWSKRAQQAKESAEIINRMF